MLGLIMKMPPIVVFGVICIFLAGCASIMERKSDDRKVIGQSIWAYDRGPYPGVRSYYAPIFREDDAAEHGNSEADLAEVGGVGGAITLGILVTPFWIADNILCIGFDTIFLPYDLVRWKTKENSVQALGHHDGDG